MTTKHHLPYVAHTFTSAITAWLNSLSLQARALWAKSGDETGSLSLPQHLGDTACVAAYVFDFWIADQMKARLSENLKLSKGQLRTLYIWLASLHDLGKATISFQTQIEQNPDFAHLVHQVAATGLPLRKSLQEAGLARMPHGISSGVILTQWLLSFGMKRRTALWLTSAVDAHHGMASRSEERDVIESILMEYPTAWKKVHREFIDTLTDLTGVQDTLRALNASKVLLAADAQILAGLIVFADWIASNQDAFPMDARGTQAERLKRGIEATDLTQPWAPIVPPEDIDELYRTSFQWPNSYSARSVQRAMTEVAGEITQPSIIILEAETGVGKTEAALTAAHIIGRQTGAQGVYFAAPTMATANGLLERTISWSQATAADGSVASLYLAHSKNQLSEPFQRLKVRGVAEDDTHSGHGAVVASSWMSGRRRGLLSNIAIGTIDQVLMLALEQRYSMLRHVALAGKIIIFDEVHAYDAYTSDYLETTLEWLAYYGATVILMSATLPPDRRRTLIRAYSEQDLPETSSAYPLITVADENSARYVTPAPSPTNMVAPIELIDDDLDSLQSLIEQLLTDGGCALVICNTIARAQSAYEQLAKTYGTDVELHHAGFMAWQRSEREDVLRTALGPQASRGNGRPYRKIVVATQVAEQSLDIDADVLITDIAPMDLIIQRAGRTHRHPRPETDRPSGLRVPKIYIRGVTQTADGIEIDGGAQAIYDPKILLATFIHFPDSFRRPDDIAELVRTTYAEQGDSIPPALRPAWEEAVNKSLERESTAHERSSAYRLQAPRGLRNLDALFSKVGAAIRLGDEEKGAAQVRDAEPSVEVIPVVRTDYGYRPFGTDKEILDGAELDYPTARHLASSTVRLPTRMTRYGNDFEEVISDLEISTPETWSRHFLLRGQLALVLDEAGKRTTGRFSVQYSSSLGIEILSDQGGGDVGMTT